MPRTVWLFLTACCLAATSGCDEAESTERANRPTSGEAYQRTEVALEDDREGYADVPEVVSSNESNRAVELSSESPDAVPVAASFRPPDERPRYDNDRFEKFGIRLYESRRLKLYTDMDEEDAARLPPLMDALFEEWEAYFGPLPPARDGSDYQLSGYLMRDQQAFRDAGMLPFDLPTFSHGKHRGQEFWMNDQEHAYYRRHLMLHEATHCFMQSMGGTTDDVPLWYLEGMAELFATHRLDEAGKPTFRVVPRDPNEFIGFGRIEMIAQDVESGKALTLTRLTALTPDEFLVLPSAYAWSWATCLLADHNPRYSEAFRELSRRYPTAGFAETRQNLLDPLTADFAIEWMLLTRGFDYGHDFRAAAIEFVPGEILAQGGVAEVQIEANRGWQSSGVRVEQGATYSIQAEGKVTLANEPRPWISQPEGVTIRYAWGAPIGRLMGLIVEDAPAVLEGTRYVGEAFSIGRQGEVTPTVTGTLYLRVNDFAAEVGDNTGEYAVSVTRESG